MEEAYGVQRIECECEYGNGIESDICWDGYILSERSSQRVSKKINNLEGYINSDYKERYLFGINGDNVSDNSLSFCLFQYGIYERQMIYYAPIDFKVLYDQDTACYYGSWYYVLSSFNTKFGGYVRLRKSIESDIDVQKINGEIVDRGYGSFYQIYSKEFAHLIKNSKSNLSINKLENNFEKAKEFFIKMEKVKKKSN